MMMGINDRQLRFEDRLLLLFCQPRIVRLGDVTELARLDGLRHMEVPVLPEFPGWPPSRFCRLAAKRSTRDGTVRGRRSDAVAVDRPGAPLQDGFSTDLRGEPDMPETPTFGR